MCETLLVNIATFKTSIKLSYYDTYFSFSCYLLEGLKSFSTGNLLLL